ncbi:gliding motility-associated C-terminal domain-containing protein [Galbibacter sp. BG1]|uniref:Ig-like domain-containing protein n=1 Tax=Galbibacter sp. BG1 TaxID=1170699 RepID=UPI0015BA022C|nr:Ig-like domain-containing protein [Galbibacter sp. BG1]QLE00796.1 gliding motility-associated C-terminal domain-containing protein [Galbibacter sp. BG1]
MKKFTTASRLCFGIIFIFLFNAKINSQTKVFATSIVSENRTENSSNAKDGNLATKAKINASSGLALGIGAYSGHIELQYPAVVPANTTSYIKIDTETNILPALLGGTLGGLLSDVLGIVLIGNQEFTVQALNGENPVLTGRSETDNDFSSGRLRVVIDAAGNYYIAITPGQNYNRIRLTNRLGSLVGLGNTKSLGLYGAYYTSNPAECGDPAFTSYDGGGLTLAIINDGGGVRNPKHAIDSNPNNFSELNLGRLGLGVLGSIQQSIYFEGSGNATDSYSIKLRLSPALVALGALDNVNIIASNKGQVVQSIPFTSLLNAEILSLIQIRANQNLPTTVPFRPGVPVDRITVRYSSLLNVEIGQSLDLFGVTRTPALPIVNANSINKQVCTGETAALIATSNPNNLELRWYDAPEEGNLLTTIGSGETFTTPSITENTVYYVATAKVGCPTESARVAVNVTAINRPVGADISIYGAEDDSCEGSTITLTPSSTIDGSFAWYFDPDKASPITDGLTQDNATYNINEDGVLSITGLTASETPINYYTSIASTTTGCENTSGNLAETTVSVISNDLNPSIAFDGNITGDNIINKAESELEIIISGTVSGDAMAGDTITLTANGMDYTGSVASDLTFNISVEGNALVTDQDLTLEVSVTTSNGTCETSATDLLTYSVDITTPTIPTVNAQSTNDTTPIITGTASSEDNISIVVNGITYTEGDGILTDNGDNTWALQIPDGDALTEGIYDVVATATDDAGNTANDTTTDELNIDLTDPEIPTVVPVTTNSNTPSISGTAASEDELTVEVNGITYSEGDGNLTDNGDDTWTLQIPDTNTLPDGTYDVVATATDDAGNSATDTTTDELTINASAPNTPTVDFLTTTDTTPTITGTADSVNDLTVEVNAIVYTEGDGNLTDNGDDTWTLQIPTGSELPDGVYDVEATLTNGAISANDATVNELIIDTIPPNNPTVNTLATNDTTPEITGTATSKDALTVEINGVTYTEGDGNLTDNGGGTWTLQIPNGNELPDDTYDVVATATDAAGNSSNDTTTDEVSISTSLPDIPSVDPQITSDNTPTITGTANSVDNLTVSLNGITYTEGDGNLTDNGNDTWTLQIPESDVLPDNTYDVVVEVTDDFGNNNNDTTTDEVTIDTTTPVIPTVNQMMTNDTTPAITGTADSADDLSIEVDGVTYTEGDGNLMDNTDNTWTLQIPNSNELTDGTYDVAVTATDGAGNTAQDATIDEVTINSSLPDNPTVNNLDTNDVTPMITGTAMSQDDLSVAVNGITYLEVDGNLTDNGDNTWSLQIPESDKLQDGVYDVVAIATDNAGNTSRDTTTDELTISNTLPNRPMVNWLTTADTTPMITGTADSNYELSVTVNGVSYIEGDGNLTDNGDDTWSLQIPDNQMLSDGFYDVKAIVTDKFGNTNTDNTLNELIIDTVSPTAPTVNNLVTNDPTPIITGTADSEDELSVMINGVTYLEGDGRLIDNSDDTWTLQIPNANALPDNVYDVVAAAMDPAGNTTADNTTDEITIDSALPNTPMVNQLTTKDPTPIITGTADSEDNLTVEVNGITYFEGDGNLTDNGDDTWTLQVPDANELPNGVYDIVAIATDDANNTATDNTIDELTIDTTLDGELTMPTVNKLVTDDKTPTITGTASSENELTVKVDGMTYAEGAGSLVDNGDDTWWLTIPSSRALDIGTYNVVATIMTSSGTTVTDITTNELTILSISDNAPPTTPTVVEVVSNDPTPEIIGTADSNDTLTVEVDGNIYTEGDGDLSDNGDDTWTLQIPTEDELQEGVYDVIVTVINDQGETATDNTTDELTIENIPVSDITITKTVDNMTPLVGEIIEFIVTVSNTGETEFKDVIIDEVIASGFSFQQHTLSTGTYFSGSGVWNIDVLAANETATLTIKVKVNPTGNRTNIATISATTPMDDNLDNNEAEVNIELSCLTVFNEFTPNNDGHNDYFRIECIEKYPNSVLKIFNRYGNKVYETKGYQNDWTGIANVNGAVSRDKKLPAGVYFYSLKIDELGEDKSGWLYIAK